VRLVVTGGAGFIGAHLVERAVALGHQVTVVDDLSSGRRENLPLNTRLVEIDITHPTAGDAIAAARPEVVFHLAAQSTVPGSIADPIRDAEVNAVGTLRVLDAATRAGARKILFASTATVYGEPPWVPITEPHAGPVQSPYAVSKLAAEGYLRAWRALHGLRYTVFRLANVYGPRQVAHADGGVVACFLAQAHAGQPLCVHGDGEQTRDFVYVGDVVDGFLRALDVADDQVLNLSTGEGTSINSLVREIEACVGAPLPRVTATKRPGDLRDIVLSTSALSATLGWVPTTTLAAGLRATWEARRHA
jgi:UDP-glucose 4-epimerase